MKTAFTLSLIHLLGIILLIWGVVFLTVDFTQTISSLVIALIATVVLFIVGLKVSSRLKLWQRMTLQDKQENSSGYVGPVHEEDLVPCLLYTSGCGAGGCGADAGSTQDNKDADNVVDADFEVKEDK